MKYTDEIVIELPIDRVVELFDDPENLKHWQPGLISFEHMSGERGQVGAKSLLKYQMGSRKIEMVETITVRNLPDEFSGTYETKGVFSATKNTFKSLPDGNTLYTCENEFRFSSFLLKVMAFLMPNAFRKQSRKYMEDFKRFAEGQGRTK